MAVEPCGRAPHCASTIDPRPARHVEPVPLPDGVELATAIDVIRGVLENCHGAAVTGHGPAHLDAVFTTKLLRFKDDVRIAIDAEARLVHGRSASRIGYHDFGANKRRLRALLGAIDTALAKRDAASRVAS